MKDMGTITRTDDGEYVVTFERQLAHSAQDVWAALTEPATLGRWLARTDVDLRVGGHYVIHFFDGKETMRGVIRALEPGHLLEYSWNESGNPQSVVCWTITGTGNACRLTLKHSLPAGSAAALAIELGGGWHVILDNLEPAMRGESAGFDASKIRDSEAAYRERYFEKGQSARVLSVNFERLLPGTVERVWRHLTEPTLLPGWFGNGTIEPKVGGRVHLMDGHIRGVVTLWQPPRRLSYTWNVFGPGDGPDAVSAYPESYLTFALEPVAGCVRLQLTHLPILERFEKQNAMGWHTLLDMLATALRGEKVEERPFYMKKNAALYGVDLNNLVR